MKLKKKKADVPVVVVDIDTEKKDKKPVNKKALGIAIGVVALVCVVGALFLNRPTTTTDSEDVKKQKEAIVSAYKEAGIEITDEDMSVTKDEDGKETVTVNNKAKVNQAAVASLPAFNSLYQTMAGDYTHELTVDDNGNITYPEGTSDAVKVSLESITSGINTQLGKLKEFNDRQLGESDNLYLAPLKEMLNQMRNGGKDEGYDNHVAYTNEDAFMAYCSAARDYMLTGNYVLWTNSAIVDTGTKCCNNAILNNVYSVSKATLIVEDNSKSFKNVNNNPTTSSYKALCGSTVVWLDASLNVLDVE